MARALRARGVAPGDRVLLVAENRPEWAIADLAIMAAGGVTVPAYTTNTIENNAYLLNHSGAVAAFVSTDRLAARLLPARRRRAGTQAGGQHGAADRSRAPEHTGSDVGRGPGAGRAERRAQPGPGDRADARRPRLLHLHLRHRRQPQGRHADPRQHPGERRRRPRGARDPRPRRRRGVPVVPAVVPRLRAHGGAVPADGGGGADLLRRRSGSSGQQLRRSAPDHRRLRTPAVRGDAPAHPADDRAATWPQGEAVRQDGRPGQQGLRTSRGDELGRKDLQSLARQAGARCRAARASAAGSRRWCPAARR